MKLLKRILKKLGFRQCYNCGKWRRNFETLRVVESPKDKDGILAPFCEACSYHYNEKTY